MKDGIFAVLVAPLLQLLLTASRTRSASSNTLVHRHPCHPKPKSRRRRSWPRLPPARAVSHVQYTYNLDCTEREHARGRGSDGRSRTRAIETEQQSSDKEAAQQRQGQQRLGQQRQRGSTTATRQRRGRHTPSSHTRTDLPASHQARARNAAKSPPHCRPLPLHHRLHPLVRAGVH